MYKHTHKHTANPFFEVTFRFSFCLDFLKSFQVGGASVEFWREFLACSLMFPWWAAPAKVMFLGSLSPWPIPAPDRSDLSETKAGPAPPRLLCVCVCECTRARAPGPVLGMHSHLLSVVISLEQSGSYLGLLNCVQSGETRWSNPLHGFKVSVVSISSNPALLSNKSDLWDLFLVYRSHCFLICHQ